MQLDRIWLSFAALICDIVHGFAITSSVGHKLTSAEGDASLSSKRK